MDTLERGDIFGGIHVLFSLYMNTCIYRQFSSYRKLVILVHSNMNFIRPVTVRLTKLLTNGGLLDIPKVRYELGNFIT